MTTVLTAKFDFSQPKSAAKQTQAQVDKLSKAAKGAQGSLDSAARSAKGAGAASAFFGKAAKGATPGVAALGTAIKAALGPIAVLTTAAGALTSAFSTLAQQDFAEAKVRSLGVDSDELTKRLSGVSRELAGQASVVELTGAAYDVASAGFTNAADAANILKAASQGATGGFSDINTVGDATTSVLNAYGLEADKAAKLVDGFIQTQNDGKIVIGQYAANIAKVAPVAAALGVPLEEVNAAVAQITAGGQGAEVTFTALKTAFAQVAAGKVGEEFKKFGIEINASTLKSEGLAGTLEKIKKSGADAGTIIKAFGTEAGPSILALLNDTEKYNKLLENQKNSQGAAAAAAFEASDTINGALKRLQTAFTNIFADGAELGLLLKSTFKVAAVTVEFLGAALKAILAPVRGLIAGVQAFFQELAPFGENINLAFELEKAFQAFMGTVSFATDVVTGLFTVIGQGVATHIGNVLNLANSIKDGVVSVFSGLAEPIGSTMASLYDQLPGPIKFIIEQAAKGFQAVKSFLGQAVSGVAEQVSGSVVQLAEVGGAVAAQSGSQPAAANAIQQTNQKLGGDQSSGKKTSKKTDLEKQQDAAKKLTANLEQQTTLAKALTSEERAMLQLKIDKANIDKDFPLLSQEERDALKDKLETLHAQKQVTAEIKELQDKAAKDKKDADDKEKERVKKLNEFYQSVADTIQAGIVDGIMGAIEGTKSLQESLSGILKSVGKMFLNQAIGSIMPTFGDSGGYVSGPTRAVIGEGGESEYLIPESKMRESMARYSRGARGAAVIPGVGSSGTSEENGGTAVAEPLDVHFTVDRINSVDYVTAEQFQRGMQQAAANGAKQGEQRALTTLRQNTSQRRRIGL